MKTTNAQIQRNTNKDSHSFGKLAIITVIAVYLLILVGGIVRSSGSGMGCPDWPKCFGSWVPPTNESQLPADYQEVFLKKRLAKNDRMASLLSGLGMTETADKLRTDESILLESEFNVINTWIEYINRLVGVAIGLLIIATFLRSLKFRKSKPSITWLTGFALVLVIFQGWLGSIVVSTNLLPWMITIHMLPALLLVAVLFKVTFKANEPKVAHFNKASVSVVVLWVMMLLTLLQIILGTQVREQIDMIAQSFGYENRELWVAQLDNIFLVHRSFSWVLLAAHIYFVFLAWKAQHQELSRWGSVLLALVIVEATVGIVLSNWGFPAVMQPVHLLLGTILFGLQYYTLLLVRSSSLTHSEYKLQTC